MNDPGKDRPARALDANSARQGCLAGVSTLRLHPITEHVICQALAGDFRAPLGRAKVNGTDCKIFRVWDCLGRTKRAGTAYI